MRWATPREMTESSQPSSSSSSFAAPAAAVAEQEDKNGVVDVEGETEQQGVMGGHSGASTGGESLELPQRPSPAAASVAVQAPHRPLSTFAGVRLQLRPPLADASAAVEVPQPPPPAPAPPPPRIHLRPASHPPEAPAAVQSHQPARFVTVSEGVELESLNDALWRPRETMLFSDRFSRFDRQASDSSHRQVTLCPEIQPETTGQEAAPPPHVFDGPFIPPPNPMGPPPFMFRPPAAAWGPQSWYPPQNFRPPFPVQSRRGRAGQGNGYMPRGPRR